MNFINSPLEQFQVNPIIPFGTVNFDLTLTNLEIFIILPFTIFVLMALSTILSAKVLPNNWTIIFDLLADFIANIIRDNVGPKGSKYFTFVYLVFIVVLLSNITGLIPYTFTATSHIIITFGLSFTIFFGVTIIGLEIHKEKFVGFFYPSGIPSALAPLLIFIEFVSYCFRALSLGIRLFANLMAGHTLLKIMSGFAWQMFTELGGIFYIVGLFPLILVLGFFALEFGVAFLQAYVFCLLTCIYLGDSINLH